MKFLSDELKVVLRGKRSFSEILLSEKPKIIQLTKGCIC